MTVGIISAIPEEYSKIDWDETPKEQKIINKTFHFGKIGGVDVIAAECGIGKVNAAMTTTLLLGHYGCDSIIFSGVAGGLNPDYKIGDVVIGEAIIQHDYGAIVNGEVIASLPGSFPSLTDDGKPVSYTMSTEMKELLETQLGRIANFGTILTGDTYLACSESREMFHKQFNADAIEMEGGAIAQVCCEWHKPFVIVRVLSDLAGDDSHVDFDEFVDDSSVKSAKIVKKLLPLMDAWE